MHVDTYFNEPVKKIVPDKPQEHLSKLTDWCKACLIGVNNYLGTHHQIVDVSMLYIQLKIPYWLLELYVANFISIGWAQTKRRRFQVWLLELTFI